MRKILVLCWFAALITGNAMSQDYKGSVGLRGGISSGFVFKGFMDEQDAFHALLSFRDNGMQATFLVEKYRPVWLDHTDRLFLFTGYGGHVGYTRWYKHFEASTSPLEADFYDRRSSPVIGADVIAGLEYRLYTHPFAFTFECKPFVELFGQRFLDVNVVDFAFSARYTFQ